MAMSLDQIKRVISALDEKDKAELAFALLESLDDASIDADVEQIWNDEAERRYAAYKAGSLESVPADAVMDRAKRPS